jgi:hypothetical protein
MPHGKKRPRNRPRRSARRSSKAPSRRKAIASDPPGCTSETPEQIALRAWTSIANALEKLIPDAIKKAEAGKPATLRIVTRFFRLPKREIDPHKFASITFQTSAARPTRKKGKQNAKPESPEAAANAAAHDSPADRCEIPDTVEAPDGSPALSSHQQTQQIIEAHAGKLEHHAPRPVRSSRGGLGRNARRNIRPPPNMPA